MIDSLFSIVTQGFVRLIITIELNNQTESLDASPNLTAIWRLKKKKPQLPESVTESFCSIV